MIEFKIYEIFKIKFIDADFIFFKKKFKKGIFLVFPAAPALINIYKDKEYYKSIKNADYALFDSGYLCILLKYFKSIKVKKFSGLKFLKFFLNELNNKKNENKLLSIDPSYSESKLNKKYLKKNKVLKHFHYTAPFYKEEIKDTKLLKIITKYRPNHILINLGGGIQEKLGFYLKKKISAKVNIICTGAAIAFLTKKQAIIPNIIDKLYLGWLFRILFNPKSYILRYLNAFKLFFMIKNENIKMKGKR
jgi:N-acetylglucosaminyldiphosphoundecaprenol N-acetyl-beta-D-mannosaminyltransferase